MTLIRRFFSGPSLMQAVLAAARHHEVDPEDLVYELIDKKHGFLKTPRGVVIEVDPDQPTKVAQPESVAPSAPESAPGEPLHRLEALTDPVAPEPPAPESASPERPALESQEPAAPERPAFAPAAHPGPAPEDAMPADSRLSDAVTPPPGQPLPGVPSSDSESRAPSAQLVGAEPSEAQAAEIEAPPKMSPPEMPTDGPVAEASPPSAGPEVAASPEAAPSSDGGSSGEAPEVNWWDAEPAAPQTSQASQTPAVEPSGDASASMAAPSPEPASPQADAVPLDDDLQSAVAQAVDELVYLAGLRVQVASAVEVDDGLTIEVEGPDSRRVVAHGGRALLAIQHLLPRLLFGRLGRAVHCRLDCEGFHEARGARLEQLARKAADRVRSGGRSWLLEPMAPDERRLVHLALADEPDVETESVGEGYLKRVRVAQI